MEGSEASRREQLDNGQALPRTRRRFAGSGAAARARSIARSCSHACGAARDARVRGAGKADAERLRANRAHTPPPSPHGVSCRSRVCSVAWISLSFFGGVFCAPRSPPQLLLAVFVCIMPALCGVFAVRKAKSRLSVCPFIQKICSGQRMHMFTEGRRRRRQISGGAYRRTMALRSGTRMRRAEERPHSSIPTTRHNTTACRT